MCYKYCLTAQSSPDNGPVRVKATLGLFSVHLVSRSLFLSSSHVFLRPFPLQYVLHRSPSHPFPCVSGCVAAGAAASFSFLPTLSKGMDAGS